MWIRARVCIKINVATECGNMVLLRPTERVVMVVHRAKAFGGTSLGDTVQECNATLH